MKRVVLALPLLVVLTAVALPTARGRPAEAGVCDAMSPSRLLENPGLAREYDQALRSGEPGALARVEALFREIRAAHGCAGEVSLPAAPRSAPSALPPGHPPIGPRGAPSRAPIIEAPGTVTI